MITLDQEINCLDCIHGSIYICSAGTPWDNIKCSEGVKPSRYTGCRKWKSRFQYELKSRYLL